MPLLLLPLLPLLLLLLLVLRVDKPLLPSSCTFRSEHGDRGGDYDLGRFVGTGWRSPASTSASEGDPTYDPGEGEASSDGGGDW